VGARAQRDAVAREVYSRVFDGIVERLNSNLGSVNVLSNDREEMAIGLLDIFGFEDMPRNGFEQMLINLTNERIQHLYNSIVIEREMSTYRQEGISLVFDPGPDNLACVNLFTSTSNPCGIVKLLSDQCLTGRDGPALVSILNGAFSHDPSYKVCGPQYIQRTMDAKGLRTSGKKMDIDYRECFGIQHYAGPVLYIVRDFLVKSKDGLPPHLHDVLQGSSDVHVSSMPLKPQNSKATVGQKFCAQLEVLIKELESSETSFVRCIKSNPQMLPGVFHRSLVLEQLVQGGVVKAVQIRHNGFPDRMTFEDFSNELYAWKPLCQSGNARSRCQSIVASIIGSEPEVAHDFVLGNTKILMKVGVLAFLRGVTRMRMTCMARRLQRWWRQVIGTEQLQKVNEVLDAFDAAKLVAHSSGLHELPGLSKILQRAQAQVVFVREALAAAWTLNGQDVRKVIVAFRPQVRLPGLREAVDTAAAEVERVKVRKLEADAELGAALGQAAQSIESLLNRIPLVEEACAGMDDDSLARKCRLECIATRHHLEELQKTGFVELKQRGLANFDCEGYETVKTDDVWQQLQLLLANAAASVIEVERLGSDLVAKRKEFECLLRQFQVSYCEAIEQLEALEDLGTRCVTEGLGGVADAIRDAWQVNSDLEQLLREASDAHACREAFQAFSAKVQLAVEAVESSLENLAAREKEHEECGVGACARAVEFIVHCDSTKWGDSLALVGEGKDLHCWGAGEHGGPLPLTCMDENGMLTWPWWTLSAPLEMQLGQQLEYKYIIVRGDGSYVWETGVLGENRHRIIDASILRKGVIDDGTFGKLTQLEDHEPSTLTQPFSGTESLIMGA